MQYYVHLNNRPWICTLLGSCEYIFLKTIMFSFSLEAQIENILERFSHIFDCRIFLKSKTPMCQTKRGLIIYVYIYAICIVPILSNCLLYFSCISNDRVVCGQRSKVRSKAKFLSYLDDWGVRAVAAHCKDNAFFRSWVQAR